MRASRSGLASSGLALMTTCSWALGRSRVARRIASNDCSCSHPDYGSDGSAWPINEPGRSGLHRQALDPRSSDVIFRGGSWLNLGGYASCPLNDVPGLVAEFLADFGVVTMRA